MFTSIIQTCRNEDKPERIWSKVRIQALAHSLAWRWYFSKQIPRPHFCPWTTERSVLDNQYLHQNHLLKHPSLRYLIPNSGDSSLIQVQQVLLGRLQSGDISLMTQSQLNNYSITYQIIMNKFAHGLKMIRTQAYLLRLSQIQEVPLYSEQEVGILE